MRLLPAIKPVLLHSCAVISISFALLPSVSASENDLTYTKLLESMSQNAKQANFDVGLKLTATNSCKVGESCPVSVTLANDLAFPAVGPFYVSFTTTSLGRLKFVQPETWRCEGENTAWLCKGPNQNLAQNVQSRFTGQFSLPISASPQDVKICAKIVWLGNPSPEYTNSRVQALQANLKSQNIVMSAVDGISTAFLNRELNKFAEKYNLNTSQTSLKPISDTLFGKTAEISSDTILSNDIACATVSYSAPITLSPSKPEANLTTALAASAISNSGLESLAPNFGATSVQKSAESVKPIVQPTVPVNVANTDSAKKNEQNLTQNQTQASAIASGTTGLKSPSTSQQSVSGAQVAFVARTVYTYAQRPYAGFTVYDIKTDAPVTGALKNDGKPESNLIRYTKLPAFGNDAPEPAQNNTSKDTTSDLPKILRGNQKPMPLFAQPGVDFTETYIQSADPEKSYKVITPNPDSPVFNNLNRLPVPVYPNSYNGNYNGGGAVIKKVP